MMDFKEQWYGCRVLCERPINVVKTGHERTVDYKVKVKLNTQDTNSGLLDVSPLFIGPIHLPSRPPCVCVFAL